MWWGWQSTAVCLILPAIWWQNIGNFLQALWVITINLLCDSTHVTKILALHLLLMILEVYSYFYLWYISVIMIKKSNVFLCVDASTQKCPCRIIFYNFPYIWLFFLNVLKSIFISTLKLHQRQMFHMRVMKC